MLGGVVVTRRSSCSPLLLYLSRCNLQPFLCPGRSVSETWVTIFLRLNTAPILSKNKLANYERSKNLVDYNPNQSLVTIAQVEI